MSRLSPSVMRTRLDAARHELLDLGLRNPLLSHRTTKARGVDVVDELPAQIHDLLVTQGRAMSFVPAPEPALRAAEHHAAGSGGTVDSDASASGVTSVAAAESGELFADTLAAYLAEHEDQQAKGNGQEGGDVAARHTDTKLQTPYTAAKLEARLLSTFYAARTFVEEQGVNVLYVALGMLRWYDDASSDKERSAPLVLVPVELTRTDVRSRFRLAYTGEDVGGNLTLQAKLKASFGLTMPLPDDPDALDVEAYFDQVEDVVADQPRWRVDRSAITVGFFLFGKLLMYNDLDPVSWSDASSPLAHPVLQALLGEGFEPPEERLDDDTPLDPVLAQREVHHVVDADGSQTLALLDVAQGHHLVVQGPPGTGKSQTITNLIAEAVGQGKKVLFVAEKMAALEVVKRRLDSVHVGDACLELHSHKTNKKDLLAELERTLKLGQPHADVLGDDPTVLVELRDRLNAYADAVNTAVGESGVTPYEAYGRLLAMRDRWGDEPPSFDEAHLDTWTAAEYQRRRIHALELQALLAKMGVPREHPFWGSGALAFLSTDEPRVRRAAHALAEATHTLATRTAVLAELLHLEARTAADAGVLCRAARRALDAPPLEGVAVEARDWHASPSALDEVLALGESYAALHERYDDVFIPQAWDADVLETRTALAAHGEKWYRWFLGDWRRAKARLAGLVRGSIPDAPDARVALTDALLEAQRLAKELTVRNDYGARLFGLQWQGVRSDWAVLRRITSWMRSLHEDIVAGKIPKGLVAFLAGGPDLDGLRTPVRAVEEALATFDAAYGAAAARVALDTERRYGAGETAAMQPFDAVRRMAEAWEASAPRLQEMVSYNHRVREMGGDAMEAIVRRAESWEAAGSDLVDALDYAWYSALLDRAQRERGALAAFDRAVHGEVVARFQERDRRALDRSQAHLALQHWSGLPRSAAIGQLGTLYREFQKKRRHLPIRKLIEQAGHAIQAIKPVFMMSPMSIAAYLPPDAVTFDLVVFDEASQVKPVDAFGAMLRGRQVVVVGDSKQLPPTSFFDSLVGEGDDEETETGDLESVLGLFNAKGAPERMLRWHYRSRHESLIAVSNREFYESRLVTFPSPDHARAETGLKYHYLPEARYDRGGRRSNRAEAQAVARAVMAHARTRPEETLMVATFSQAQQKEVWDQLEILRRQDSTLEAFFDAERFEHFDVKNLENVQGDERDVVFISVGYGRDQAGSVSMNFGPLNREGGERRLNVLISRARRRCEVFTNLRHDDLDLSRTSARGVAAFKRYLQYAATGELDVHEATGRPPESPFEEAVAAALRIEGYDVTAQVGVGSYRIDLAVSDPERPGRFLVGIECDGATYHSARTARDRDRIRQSVLEGLGWQLHRIWSTDYFRDPERELRRAVEAVEGARARALGGDGYAASRPAPPDVTRGGAGPSAPVPEDTSGGSAVANPAATTQASGRAALVRADAPDAHDSPASATLSEPYVTAKVTGYAADLHEVSTERLAADVVRIVEVEGPVHVDEVARRIMDASGVTRLGSRIRSAMEAAAKRAVKSGVARAGDFLSPQGQAAVPVRDRSALGAASRKIEYVAPAEVREAILRVVDASFGIAAEDVALEVARLFGFAQTSAQIRAYIEKVLISMQKKGELAERGGVLVRP